MHNAVYQRFVKRTQRNAGEKGRGLASHRKILPDIAARNPYKTGFPDLRQPSFISINNKNMISERAPTKTASQQAKNGNRQRSAPKAAAAAKYVINNIRPVVDRYRNGYTQTEKERIQTGIKQHIRQPYGRTLRQHRTAKKREIQNIFTANAFPTKNTSEKGGFGRSSGWQSDGSGETAETGRHRRRKRGAAAGESVGSGASERQKTEIRETKADKRHCFVPFCAAIPRFFPIFVG